MEQELLARQEKLAAELREQELGYQTRLAQEREL